MVQVSYGERYPIRFPAITEMTVIRELALPCRESCRLSEYTYPTPINHFLQLSLIYH